MKISVAGAERRPRKSKSWFSSPSVCNRITHAVVRTSTDVQKGRSTRTSSQLLILDGDAAITYATGEPISRQSSVTQALIQTVLTKSAL